VITDSDLASVAFSIVLVLILAALIATGVSVLRGLL
jgi:hypothetical protein